MPDARVLPGDELIEGEPNQSADYRWLLGWVDIDQLVKMPVAPAAADTAPAGS